MKTLKRFILYLIMFLGLFVFVSLLRDVGLKKDEEKYFSNYKILKSSPVIMVKEARASNSGGYLKGYILNETGEHIKDKFIQFDFYNKYGNYLGTKSKEIKYFNVNESINFDIPFDFREVDEITIDFVDEVKEQEVQKNLNFLGWDRNDLAVKVGVPIGLVMALMYVLP